MITHREDSIKELQKKHSPEAAIDSLGKQLSKSMLENMKKDQIIASLGKEQAQTALEVMKARSEIKQLNNIANELKGGK